MAEYIEREVALESLMYAMCGTGYQATAMMEVRRIPAADVAPVVHGRWSWDTGDIWTCSVCGTCNHIKEVMGRHDFNYCPNCGAKMDK